MKCDIPLAMRYRGRHCALNRVDRMLLAEPNCIAQIHSFLTPESLHLHVAERRRMMVSRVRSPYQMMSAEKLTLTLSFRGEPRMTIQSFAIMVPGLFSVVVLLGP